MKDKKEDSKSKKSKTDIKKVTNKKPNKNQNKKKGKAFTLIELLAVIIILGVLMLVAIPSVTAYINNSRKEAYIDTARHIIKGAVNKVNSAELDMFDTGVTYYIPSSCIELETGGDSPYGGKFAPAYVIVTYDNNSYNYYWMSRDDNGIGIKTPVSSKKLESKQIEAGIKPNDVLPEVGIDGRETIIVFNDDCSEAATPAPATSVIPGEEGGGTTSSGIAVYPTGKTKDTVDVGDIVTIDTEEFYVVKRDGSDLVLLSHYNLNVGSNKKAGATEGIQDSEVKGYVLGGTIYGNIAFSSTNYWNGKVGTDYPENYCTSSGGTNCVYVYDSNSNLKTYVDAYKTYLEGKGATIKSARLLRVEEAFELGCETSSWTCNSAPAFVKETSYWLGSASDALDVWNVCSDGDFDYYDFYFDDYFGVRPVIVI